MGRLKKEYYIYVLDETVEKPPAAKRILFDLVQDFTDRRGLRQEWEQIDDEIQEMILARWLEIIEAGTESKG